MRLSTPALDRLPVSIERFSYPREQQEIGIVHLGIGSFHRAHQAYYTDLALDAGSKGWGIAGVSLRSRTQADRLNPQDCLYSLTTAADAGACATRIIGAVRQVIAANGDEGTRSAIARIASPETRIISLTVTEKGYARYPFESEQAQKSAPPIYPLLSAGLRARRMAGLGGVTLLSCDNLQANGERLRTTLVSYLDGVDPETADWVSSNCTFPSTMVDRIVPAATPADLRSAAAILGVEDRAALVTEPFIQWVFEDRFAAGRPAWDQVGATVATNVRPFETAKLRMLNGAHSALAYLGLERGHEFVDQAVADPELRPLVEALMRHEAANSFEPAPEQDLSSYADQLLLRFANSGLRHRLDQIASDGSQKIPQRWLATITDRRSRGLDSPAIITALSAWTRFVRGDRGPVDDPLAGHFAALWKSEGPGGIAAAMFSERGTFANALTRDEQIALTAQLFSPSGKAAERAGI